MRQAPPSTAAIAQLPSDGGDEFNRLIFEKSPYLLQHARNPVDWYPWGEEALTKAREEDKPIFLSVGYSTCHWCHVMEHESFQDAEVAELLNRLYVPIKVDREERPDLDEIYMSATHALMRRGGWPNSLWLTFDAKPFYAGTYFPKNDRTYREPGGGARQQLGFMSMLQRLASFWVDRRDDALAQADRITEAIAHQSQMQRPGEGQPSRHLYREWLGLIDDAVDREYGGFSLGGPKFPAHGILRLLLWESNEQLHRASTQDPSTETVSPDPQEPIAPDVLDGLDAEEATIDTGGSAWANALGTLESMARGGIYDHVGGGFHRYSTDERWHVPHFEKMLCDNAQLAWAYAEAYRLGKAPFHARVALGIAEWMLREMRHDDEGFYSAIDADSEGEEGVFYVWTRAEVLAILGSGDGPLYCEVYGIEAEGNWHDEATGKPLDTNIPFLSCTLEETAAKRGDDPEDFVLRMQSMNNRLLAERVKREWPAIDDKILSAWNGLAISAMAKVGSVLKNEEILDAARGAATYVLKNLVDADRFYVSTRDGEAKIPAYLDDYAFMANAFLDLYEATHLSRWLDSAKRFAQWMVERFSVEGGGFYFTSHDHEQLIVRTCDPLDKAIPSGNGVATIVLLRLARIERSSAMLNVAEKTLVTFANVMTKYRRGTESLLYASRLFKSLVTERRNSEITTFPRGDLQVSLEPVELSAYVSGLKVAPERPLFVAIRVVIQEGYHLQSFEGADSEIEATTLRLANEASFQITATEATASEEYTLGDLTLEGHARELWILAGLHPKEALGERRYPLSFELRFQACGDNRCLAPQVLAFKLPVTVEIGASTGVTRHKEIFKRFTWKKVKR